MPRIRIYEYRLPDYLAAYLINGDATGLTDAEQSEIDAFLKKEKVTIVEIKENSSFYHRNDLNNLGANCSTYLATRLPRNRTIDKIITKVNCKSGAPMSRLNVGSAPNPFVKGLHGGKTVKKFRAVKVYDCLVPMNGAYDRGGVYWGMALHGVKPLRVKYTKDLSYIEFYRPS